MKLREKRAKIGAKALALSESERLNEEKSSRLKVKELASQVALLADKPIKTVVKEQVSFWFPEQYIPRPIDRPIRIDDPIYRRLMIASKLGPLLSHPMVRRLNHIRQLSFSYMTFPSATHSRLSHSLGVGHIMEWSLMMMLLKRRVAYSEKGIVKLPFSIEELDAAIEVGLVVGILHDIGHGPFAHALDRFFGFKCCSAGGQIFDYPDKTFTWQYAKHYLKTAIESSGIDVDRVLGILDRSNNSLEGLDVLISNLLDSPTDVDRLDYMARDAHFTGVPVGNLNIQAIMDTAVPFYREEAPNCYSLCFEKEAIPYIRHFLDARVQMYTMCYENDKKIAAERMITKAMEDFSMDHRDVNLLDLHKLTDETLIGLLFNYSPEGSACRELVRRLLEGRTFEDVYSAPMKEYRAKPDTYPNIDRFIGAYARSERVRKSLYLDEVLALEKELAEKSGIRESWKVAIFVPPPEAVPEPVVGTRILVKAGNGYKTEEICVVNPEVKEILDAIMYDRQRIVVFADSGLSNDDKGSLEEKARRHFETRS
jgi:HD superfamily phosphohydrolase